MKLVEVVKILGAFSQTTKKNVGNFRVAKLHNALRDCEAICALPCDSYKRAQILATKVLPQIAFAPQLNLPKRLLARLQSFKALLQMRFGKTDRSGVLRACVLSIKRTSWIPFFVGVSRPSWNQQGFCSLQPMLGRVERSSMRKTS